MKQICRSEDREYRKLLLGVGEDRVYHRVPLLGYPKIIAMYDPKPTDDMYTIPSERMRVDAGRYASPMYTANWLMDAGYSIDFMSRANSFADMASCVSKRPLTRCKLDVCKVFRLYGRMFMYVSCVLNAYPVGTLLVKSNVSYRDFVYGGFVPASAVCRAGNALSYRMTGSVHEWAYKIENEAGYDDE